VGAWYTVGVVMGFGVAAGLAGTALFRRAVVGLIAGAVVAVLIGLLVWGWAQAVGGAIGAASGSLGSAPLVAGTLRRGGTRGGTATLLAAAALVGAALAVIPVVGYLEAVAVPALGLRLRRRAPDRHAGLRTLARD